MGARQAGLPMTLALAAGQVQRVLVEAGSTVVVTQGALTVRLPFAWLAECVVPQAVRVMAEEAYRLPDGGWFDLAATGATEAVILPPEGARLWDRLARAFRLAAAPKNARDGRDAAAGV